MKKLKIVLGILLAVIIVVVSWQSFLQPSNARDWQEGVAVLSYAEFQGEKVIVHNIRNFHHTSATEQTIDYYDKTFNLNDLEKVYFIVEHYSDWQGAAHTFVSFQFAGETFLAITVEARMEKDETYNAVNGLFKQYELAYIVGDESDVIKQRLYKNRDFYLYPVKTTKAKAQTLFVDMLQRATELKDKPEFYNTITDSCTTSIVKHVNHITPNRIPFSYKYLLPGYSDELAYDIGLLDTDLPLAQAREKFKITSQALEGNDSDFSLRIRQLEN